MIHAAGTAALRAGVRVSDVIEMGRSVAGQIPVVAMVYANPIFTRGAERFVDSLKIVLKDDDLRRRLGSKCREYSETMFSIESVSKGFENVLAEAANSQGPT